MLEADEAVPRPWVYHLLPMLPVLLSSCSISMKHWGSPTRFHRTQRVVQAGANSPLLEVFYVVPMEKALATPNDNLIFKMSSPFPI